MVSPNSVNPPGGGPVIVTTGRVLPAAMFTVAVASSPSSSVTRSSAWYEPAAV